MGQTKVAGLSRRGETGAADSDVFVDDPCDYRRVMQSSAITFVLLADEGLWLGT